jgi:putative SOS response-associated peptidase YedK
MCYSPFVQKSLKVLEADFGIAPVREMFTECERLHDSDPRKFPDFSREQIFPGHFAPVVTKFGIEPMRYGAWPSVSIKDPGRYTTYNARIENLDSPFWCECPEAGRGVVEVTAFLEWVEVRILLQDRQISLGEVESLFAAKAAERRRALEKKGKPYKLSSTEQKNARDRKITILISPKENEPLFVPVVFSRHAFTQDFQGPRGGFAIITGPAPAEIQRAGHDRCPLHLTLDGALEWLCEKPPLRESIGRQSNLHFVYRLESGSL